MDERTAIRILKDADVIKSKEEFDALRKRKHFTSAFGRSAAQAIMNHYAITEEGKKRNQENRVTNWLNGKSSQVIFELKPTKRPRVDLNMSFEEDGQREMLSEIDQLKKELKEKNDQVELLMEENAVLKATETGQLFGKVKKWNQFQPQMQCVALKALSKGIEASHVHFVTSEIANSLGFRESDVPSYPTLARWRDEMIRPLVQNQIDEFIEEAESLTLALDCTSMAGSSKVSCLLLINQDHENKLIDLVPSIADTGIELKDQVLARLYNQPKSIQIIKKMRAIQSDLGPVQLKCNRLMKAQLENSPHRQGLPSIAQLNCGMHR